MNFLEPDVPRKVWQPHLTYRPTGLFPPGRSGRWISKAETPRASRLARWLAGNTRHVGRGAGAAEPTPWLGLTPLTPPLVMDILEQVPADVVFAATVRRGRRAGYNARPWACTSFCCIPRIPGTSQSSRRPWWTSLGPSGSSASPFPWRAEDITMQASGSSS